MEKFLLKLKKSYLLVFIAIAFACILMFIDSKISNRSENEGGDYTRKDYIKLALIVGFVATGIVYIHTITGKVEEEIMTGVPPF